MFVITGMPKRKQNKIEGIRRVAEVKHYMIAQEQRLGLQRVAEAQKHYRMNQKVGEAESYKRFQRAAETLEQRQDRREADILTKRRKRVNEKTKETQVRQEFDTNTQRQQRAKTTEEHKQLFEKRDNNGNSIRGMRNDSSLVPPIRQTASIFKQPVTVYKLQEGKVKTDFKHGPQEKPKQLFWEKRLEGLKACDMEGNEIQPMELPKVLKPVGPNVSDETTLQSVATSLHVSSQPITGQTGSKSSLEKNPGVFLNPEQPLVQAVAISDDDIKRQEDRVSVARKRLQECMKELYS